MGFSCNSYSLCSSYNQFNQGEELVVCAKLVGNIYDCEVRFFATTEVQLLLLIDSAGLSAVVPNYCNRCACRQSRYNPRDKTSWIGFWGTICSELLCLIFLSSGAQSRPRL